MVLLVVSDPIIDIGDGNDGATSLPQLLIQQENLTTVIVDETPEKIVHGVDDKHARGIPVKETPKLQGAGR